VSCVSYLSYLSRLVSFFDAQQFYTACVVFGPLLWAEMFKHAGPSRTTLVLGVAASLAVGAAVVL
jgi:hypothetical protein